MTATPFHRPREPGSVLPIRGGRDHVPGTALVQGALGASPPREAVRAALAVVFAVAERARRDTGGERFWWETAVRVSAAEVAAEMGILASEARDGMELLRDAGVVRDGGAGEGVQLDPDVLCEQPLLAAIDWPGVRTRLEGERRIGPALAVLRELGRLGSARGADAPVATHLPELVDATLYGRSAVAQALQDLERAGLVERAGARGGRGARLRITRRALGEGAGAPAAPARDRDEDAARPPLAAPATGFVLEVGGASLEVPPGARVSVESDPGGTPRVRIRFPGQP